MTIAGGEDLRWGALASKEVDDVQEALKFAIVIVVANGYESSRYSRCQADGVLGVEILYLNE